MIMGMFAGFVVICVMMLFFYGVSLAITFWFISIPLFEFWFFVEVKRTQRRAKVPLSPRAQYYLDLHRAVNDREAVAKAREKAEVRGY
jgi:hypothetical protein